MLLFDRILNEDHQPTGTFGQSIQGMLEVFKLGVKLYELFLSFEWFERNFVYTICNRTFQKSSTIFFKIAAKLLLSLHQVLNRKPER